MRILNGGGNWRDSAAIVLAASCLIGFGVVEATLAAGQRPQDASSALEHEGQWRGVHLMSPGSQWAALTQAQFSEKLAPWVSMP